MSTHEHSFQSFARAFIQQNLVYCWILFLQPNLGCYLFNGSARARVRGFLNRLARENRKTVFVGLFFDGQEFVLDKEGLLAIDDVFKTVSEGMGDPEGVIFPLLYREIVMNRVGK